MRTGITTLLAVILSLAACTSERTPAELDDDGDGVVVIRLGANLRFSPASVTIPAGTTVRWVNDVTLFHTITPDSAEQPGVWVRRGVNAANETFSHTFTQAGETYTYHCEPHLANGMVGTITVQ